MRAWMISIVGVIALGVLLEIVLPEGKTSKYVKGAFSLLVVFSIVAPLPGLFKKDWQPVIDGSGFEVDGAYVEQTYRDHREKLESAIEKYLGEQGVEARASVTLDGGDIAHIDVKVKGETDGVAKLLSDRLLVDAALITVTQN